MAAAKPKPKNTFTFKDEKPASFNTEYTTTIRDSHVPLIIDNGGYQCRAGWATSRKPDLVFKNVTAKPRGRKEKSSSKGSGNITSRIPDKDLDVQIGNDITNLEVVRWQMKSQFDRNIVTLYDVQEQVLDYMFANLGITTSGHVDHPIVMTEPVANPNHCRQQMSELLFECYHIPKVAYGVDSLFSLVNNHPQPERATAMVIDCGYQATHIIPVLDGRMDMTQCRRLNIGGAHIDGFMQRLLQLKHPGHVNTVTLSRAEEIVRDHTHVGVDYLSELEDWKSHDYYDENVHKIQLPFANVPGSQIPAQQQKERREQQIRRLKDFNFNKRTEKLAQEEEELRELTQIQELLASEDEEEFNTAMRDREFENAEELQAVITRLSGSIQRLKAKLQGKTTPADDPETGAPKKQKVFELLEIPDEQLEPEQLAMKKRQYILQKAREGRARAQAIQKQKREKEREAEKALEQQRLEDFHGWLHEVRAKRQKLIESRSKKKQKKSDMGKRRTYAAQQRMRIISQLAKNTKKEDTFGQDDKDWDVYKEINPDNSDSDSEAEDKLEELETMLKEHDPEFQKQLDEAAGEFDIAEYYRLHIAVERIRAPELLFQPSMIGVEQGGIAEGLDYVFKKFSSHNQDRLAQNVFLTGNNANFPRFKERMSREVLEMRPFQSTFDVHLAANPALDAWLGARRCVLQPTFNPAWITRADYEEKGGDYLREHVASNRYLPTPVLVPS